MAERTNRRGFLNKTLLGAVGAGAVLGAEEDRLLAALDQQPATGPQTPQRPRPAKDMPRGKIGKVSLSRLILGGNLIGGWAHSRDLIYVSKLFKAYNTEAKIFETIELAQACGINAIQLDPRDASAVLKYNQTRSNKIQILMCYNAVVDPVKTRDEIKRLVDEGVVMLHVHGGVADQLVLNGRIDVIAKAVEMVKAEGIPAGVSGHSLETPMACEKHNVNADYYLKTFHLDRYWSATPQQTREEWCWYKGATTDHDKYNDNMFCLDPEKTAAFMQTVSKPWIAFKVMAAGAIQPHMAFSHAFRNGADFILAGMFDFQVEADARLVTEALPKARARKRPWCG
jgi:hypothetical protein